MPPPRSTETHTVEISIPCDTRLPFLCVTYLRVYSLRHRLSLSSSPESAANSASKACNIEEDATGFAAGMLGNRYAGMAHNGRRPAKHGVRSPASSGVGPGRLNTPCFALVRQAVQKLCVGASPVGGVDFQL